MISLNLSFATPGEMYTALAAIMAGAPGASAVGFAAPVEVAVKAPKPVKAEKPAATPTASETATPPKAQEPAQPEPAAASLSEEGPKALDYGPVGAVITRLVNEGQRDKVLATLATFGAKKGPELKPEQYEDFLKAVAL